MDIKKLANLLIIGGIAMLAAAWYWWSSFYEPILQRLHLSLSDASRCLYSNSGTCALSSGIAQLLGRTPYDPLIFWLGCATLLIGLVIRITLKPQA